MTVPMRGVVQPVMSADDRWRPVPVTSPGQDFRFLRLELRVRQDARRLELTELLQHLDPIFAARRRLRRRLLVGLWFLGVLRFLG